jgi:hypothetical protein
MVAVKPFPSFDCSFISLSHFHILLHQEECLARHPERATPLRGVVYARTATLLRLFLSLFGRSPLLIYKDLQQAVLRSLRRISNELGVGVMRSFASSLEQAPVSRVVPISAICHCRYRDRDLDRDRNWDWQRFALSTSIPISIPIPILRKMYATTEHGCSSCKQPRSGAGSTAQDNGQGIFSNTSTDQQAGIHLSPF